VARLGLQHHVWQSRVLDAWRRAGFGAGQRLADIGSGPGFAALDLAEIVARRATSSPSIDRAGFSCASTASCRP
jgi:16S rRNA G527 N7-methylase RsmG